MTNTSTKEVNLSYKVLLHHPQGVILKIAPELPIHFNVQSVNGRLTISMEVDE